VKRPMALLNGGDFEVSSIPTWRVVIAPPEREVNPPKAVVCEKIGLVSNA